MVEIVNLAAAGEVKGVATGTFENELMLGTKTGYAFSTCTEVLFRLGDSEVSRLEGQNCGAACDISFEGATDSKLASET